MKPHTYRYRLMESDLPGSVRGVAHVLATRANYETGHVKISLRRLAEWTGYNRDTCAAALKVLTLSGWLIVLAQKHERAPREYRIAVPVSGTDESVDNTPEDQESVPVSGTVCPSEWDKSVPVSGTPIPLEEFPACPAAPQSVVAEAAEPVADHASRDAIILSIASGMRLP